MFIAYGLLINTGVQPMSQDHRLSLSERVLRMFRTIALLLAIMQGTALAADSTGNYMVGGGSGSVLCSEFVKVLEQATAKGERTIGYVNIMQGFTMYLHGFRSGYNKAAPDTYDIFSGIEEQGLINQLAIYCKENPRTRFGIAVSALAERNYSTRIREYVP